MDKDYRKKMGEVTELTDENTRKSREIANLKAELENELAVKKQLLEETKTAPTLSIYKNAAQSLINDMDSAFDDITKADIPNAQKFLEALNSQTVSGFFKGTSDAATSEINAGTARAIREAMDKTITETTGEGYQSLRSQYSALKSIEDDLS